MRRALRHALLVAAFASSACRNYTTGTVLAPLEAPVSISSISLDSAIFLDWADNAFQSDPQGFAFYNVYSASYNLDLNLCGTDWALEGTTVSHVFLAGQLPNGVPRCFATSATGVDGSESAWSPRWQDTPRPDARNVVVWAHQVDPTRSGFRFWNDANGNGYGDAGELGLVQDGTFTDLDFRIERDANDTLWIVPVFSGTSVLVYGRVADLTDIDFAPVGGYSGQPAKVLPGFGYVFEIIEGQEVRYGALRVTHAGSQYAIVDWSFQTDRGNPELVVPNRPVLTGQQVAVSR